MLKIYTKLLKDSLEFSSKCQRETERETVIATFNVVRLYTSILNDLVVEAIDCFVTNFCNDLYPRIPKPFVIEAADFVLKNKTLTFGSRYYLEIQGTAMDTIFAPTCTLRIGYHEQKVYSTSKNRLMEYLIFNLYKYFMENWRWFSDDCEILINPKYINPQYLLEI